MCRLQLLVYSNYISKYYLYLLFFQVASFIAGGALLMEGLGLSSTGDSDMVTLLPVVLTNYLL